MAKRDFYEVLGCGKDAPEAELKKVPTVPVLGGPALFVQLDREGKRMLGVIASDGRGGLVFVKMVGPTAKVEKATPAFLVISRSLRPKGGNAGMRPHGEKQKLSWAWLPPSPGNRRRSS